MMRPFSVRSGPHRRAVRYRGRARGGRRLARLREGWEGRRKNKHGAEADAGDPVEHDSVSWVAERRIRRDAGVVSINRCERGVFAAAWVEGREELSDPPCRGRERGAASVI